MDQWSKYSQLAAAVRGALCDVELVTRVLAQPGSAVNFAAGTDSVQAPDAASLRITGDMTIEAWVNPTNYSAFRGVLAKTLSNVPAPFDYFLASGTGIPRFLRGNGTVSGFVNATAAPATGTWAHIAAVMSGTTVTHYLNGVPNGTGTLSTTIADAGHALWIGAREDGGWKMLGGLDEVRIWNVARTQSQIFDMMKKKAQGNEAGLVACWSFDENGGTTAFDSTPNANNGTLTNGPTWIAGVSLDTEFINLRRALVKKLARQGNKTVITCTDIDRTALDKIFPFDTYTVADFPQLFTDHVGRAIGQGNGQAVRVPLSWLTKNSPNGVWSYGVCKNLPNTTITVQTVYRGTVAGQGAIVDPSEWTQSTLTGASTGVSVVVVNFAREQIDFSSKPYVIEADVLITHNTGSNTAPYEISRILGLYGISFDSASFTAAASGDLAIPITIDAFYGDNGRTGAAIISDLLWIARGWMFPNATGQWALVQDVAKSATIALDSFADELSISNYGDGDIHKTITLDYHTKSSVNETYANTLSRTVANGTTGDLHFKSPYARNHVVADRLVSYWAKRLASLRVGEILVYGLHIQPGTVITVTDNVAWVGTKTFLVVGVNHEADSSRCQVREYDATIYTYTAGTLPADATSGYEPDYSYTKPVAPTNVAVVSGGCTSDASGRVRAYQLVHATPPAANWAKLTALITDATTGELYSAQMTLNGGTGFYEATIPNLPPNASMTLTAYATNSNNVDGLSATPVAFTSATSSTIPAAPASASINQSTSLQLDYSWATVPQPTGGLPIDHYQLEESVNSGAFSVIGNIPAPAVTYKRNSPATGSTYQLRVAAIDKVGNVGSKTTSGAVTAAKVIDDTHVVTNGLTGGSIANGSINQGRASTGTTSLSGTLNNGFSTFVVMDLYTFFPAQWVTGSNGNLPMIPYTTDPLNDRGTFGWSNSTGANQSWGVRYRNFSP